MLLMQPGMQQQDAKAPSAHLHLVTMGDSTLDNLIWMDKDPMTQQFPVHDCVIGQLRKQLPPHSTVTNLAADGFTSSNVLHGAAPMLSRAAWARSNEPFPSDTDPSGILRPLDELASLHATKPVTHVLLSVGGNDVRVILQAMHKLPQVVATFHENYSKIVQHILSMDENIHLIVMLQYQVCLTHEHGGYGVYTAMSNIPGPGTGAEKLQMLMERIYAPVIALAKEHQLMVIDLPRTFDPSNEELYRLQIEPSQEGGGLIANVVGKALARHDFDGGSYLYSMVNGQFRSEANVFHESKPWRIVRSGGGEGGSGGGGVGGGSGGSGAHKDNGMLNDGMNHAFAARAAHVEALPHAVTQLMAMGFKEQDVKKALSENGNLPQQALEVLLNN